MADDTENATLEAEGDAADAKAGGRLPSLPGRFRKPLKIALFTLIPLALVGGGGVAVWKMGVLDKFLGKTHGAEDELVLEEENRAPGAFVELPDLLVNLESEPSGARFLKIGISLEVADEKAVAAVEQALPRVVDHFQVYLRELRIEDLRGSTGVHRLRQELMARVSAAAFPVEVRDVLFREILIQ